MSKRVDMELSHLLDDAEANKRFAMTSDSNLLRCVARRERAGELAVPFPRMFARPSYVDALSHEERHLHGMRTLAKRHPSWIFAKGSAALAQGLFVDRALTQTICVASSYTKAAAGVRHERLRVRGVDRASGVLVTAMLQTMVDCLRVAPFEQGLGIADSALASLRLDRVHAAELVREGWSSTRGVERALRTLAWANPLSESGGESYVRARILLLGFAEPMVQMELPDPLYARSKYRVDLFWRLPDGVTIAGEVDGQGKYKLPDSSGEIHETKRFIAERQRESRLTIGVDRIFRITPAQARSDAYMTYLLGRYGVPRTGASLAVAPCAGVPFVLS